MMTRRKMADARKAGYFEPFFPAFANSRIDRLFRMRILSLVLVPSSYRGLAPSFSSRSNKLFALPLRETQATPMSGAFYFLHAGGIVLFG